MAQIMNFSSILSESIENRAFQHEMKPQRRLILLHLRLLHIATSVLYVLLESIDLKLLKLIKWA